MAIEDQELETLRIRIDQIDRTIVDNLRQRAGVVKQIKLYKQERGLPVWDPARESELLAELMRGEYSPLPAVAIKHIFTEIISACREMQRSIRVSYLGPESTFSHVAALDRFGHSAEFVPKDSIREVFREVENGRSDYGVVPVENSTEGTVGVTLDQFFGSSLKICGETYLRVSHALLSLETDMSKIKRVMSHPQPLGQCLDWLAQNLPTGALVPTSSTAAAAARAAQEPGSAAIGHELLGEKFKLNVLAQDIQDRSVNLTRFLIVGLAECRPTGRDKTSIWFMASHRPGTLYNTLKPLANLGINLTRIESRPSIRGPWEYAFFLDFEGHAQEPTIKAALDQLRQVVESLTILGSYPMADPNGSQALEVAPWSRGLSASSVD
ncbi:MAG: prephenate dehydratase [Deltaproteobacteria bacterium]|nr:prephenate dehydratase [Deltaproteobacteria bacterium]